MQSEIRRDEMVEGRMESAENSFLHSLLPYPIAFYDPAIGKISL
jgi:hypothetical protein